MAQRQLKRLLGKGFSVATVIGLIVGLGIMRTPGEIAKTVADPAVYLSLWIGGGLFVLLTVATIAELYAMTPRSGGIYALVRNAYGAYPGFVIGWTDAMANTASGALKAVVMAEYIAILYPPAALLTTQIALVSVSFFALLQLAGVKAGSRIQQGASMGFGLIMVGLTLVLLSGFLRNGTADVPNAVFEATHLTTIEQWGLVITSIAFTYDGWFAPSYFSGEMKSGPRDAAVGAIRGILLVIAFYVFLNLALVLAVPLGAIAGHELALSAAIEIVLGQGAGIVVVCAAIFILLSHQNLQYMIISRTVYALSVDGLGSDKATAVSDKGTPTVAVLFIWICMAGLIIAGGFRFLLALVTFMLMLTYVAGLIGVFRLRRSRPNAERPFRAWGYPWVGILLIACWAAIVAFVGFTNQQSVGYALLLVAVSAPAYWWLKRLHRLNGATDQAV